LIDWHKRPAGKQPELDALGRIFELKRADASGRWWFVYVDGVRREFVGPSLKELAREASEIREILPCFDETIMVSHLPTTLPFVVLGKTHDDAKQFFLERSVSKADARVLADTVFLGCNIFVTTDGKLRGNDHAIREAARVYDLRVATPVEFLDVMQEHVFSN
jgi:hypothetical protein